MNFFRPIGVAGLAWSDAARGLTRRSVWPPLLTLVSIELLLLAILTWFYVPPLVTWARPLVNLLSGESATHYPAHLYAIPKMFDRVAMVVQALGVPIVAGALCIRFAELFRISFGDAPPSSSSRGILRLVTVGIVTTLLPVGTEALILGALDPAAEPVTWLPMLLAMVSILALALFLYCVPAIVLQDLGVIPATRAALRAARRSPVPTLLVTSISLSVLYPLTVLVPQSDLRELSLRPELSVVLVLTRIVLHAMIWTLLIGAFTRLYAPRRSRR